MKLIKIRAPLPKDELIKVISDSELVNRNVKFDKYIPEMRTRLGKKDPDKLRITCRMTNTPTRDNGFITGTYFSGRVTEKNGVTTLKGYIATAPVYHLVLFAFVVFFIYRCITLGGFNPIPVILVAFDIFMFWREFKKQGLIERYIYRAVRRACEK